MYETKVTSVVAFMWFFERRKTLRDRSYLVQRSGKSQYGRDTARWLGKIFSQFMRQPRSRPKYFALGSAVIILVLTCVSLYTAVDGFLRWTWLPKYASRSEMNFRRQRFPSIEERVRIYMSNWYKPPCDSTGQVVFQRKLNATAAGGKSRWSFFGCCNSPNDQYYYELTELESTLKNVNENSQRMVVITNEIRIGRMFYLDGPKLNQCFEEKRLSIRFYCSDAAKSIFSTAMPDVGWLNNGHVPVLCQFSDETASLAHDATDLSSWQSNPRIPHIKKIRFSIAREEFDRLTKPADDMYGSSEDCESGRRGPPKGMTQMQPIIWLLNINRHFKYSWDVRRYDIPWQDKRDAAVFRGLLTGLEYDADASAEKNCQSLIRCRLVYENADSQIVDAKLTSTFDKVPAMFHGVNLTGETLLKEELLTYKGFIILEGNDVSSGLKWAMVSNSVVLMPLPRFTSWSMEELLEPWVHYIPIRSDISDVEDKVQWMLDHQAESQRIAHRARLWVLDLYYHPDAMKDNRLINQEVLRRYRAHFRSIDEGEDQP